MEKVILSKYEDQIRKNMMKIFKETYIKFIYAENWSQSLEYAMQTGANLFWLEYMNQITPDNAERIRKFMLDNLGHNQEWKNRLVSLTV